MQALEHDYFSCWREAMLPDGRGAAEIGYGTKGRQRLYDEQDKLVQTLVEPALFEESKIVTVAAPGYHAAAVVDHTGRGTAPHGRGAVAGR